MIDGYDFFYGNKNVELGFRINPTPALVEYLDNCGFLDSEEVNEELYDETDVDYWTEMAQPIFDAVIDYYEDRVESTLEVECDKMNNGQAYDEDFVEMSEIDQIHEMAVLDPIWYGVGGMPLVECGYHYDKRGE